MKEANNDYDLMQVHTVEFTRNRKNGPLLSPIISWVNYEHFLLRDKVSGWANNLHAEERV